MDVGSLADWVAALGGVMSVGATGYIALHERNRANRLEEVQTDLEAVRRAAVVDEAIRLAARVTAEAGRYKMLVDLGGLQSGSAPASLYTVCEEVRNQLTLLQGFPGNDPRLFVGLGSLAIVLRFDHEASDGNPSYVKIRSENLIRKVNECCKQLEALK